MTGQRRGMAIAMTDEEREESADALAAPEQLFADKYMGGGRFRYDGRHGWLLVTPAKIVSWDFAKLDPLRR
jgi:hypothetical protein